MEGVGVHLPRLISFIPLLFFPSSFSGLEQAGHSIILQVRPLGVNVDTKCCLILNTVAEDGCGPKKKGL